MAPDASTPTDFSAADSTVGHLYQVRLALLSSLERLADGQTFTVYLETHGRAQRERRCPSIPEIRMVVKPSLRSEVISSIRRTNCTTCRTIARSERFTLFDLPDYPAEVFPRSPLKNVICQVRYEEVLRVAQEPVAFQEAVRERFPRLTRQHGVQMVFGNAGGQAGVVMGWQFRSRDNHTILTLSSGALSLETDKYVDFPTFMKDLTIGLDALAAVYAPGPFVRVGLRYVNEVVRRCSGKERPSWDKWLTSDLVSNVMKSSNTALRSAATLLTMNFGVAAMNFRYGMTAVQIENAPGEALVIDADYFAERETEPGAAITLLTECNDKAYRVFRWSIGTELERRIRLPADEVDDGTIFGNQGADPDPLGKDRADER